MDSIRCFAGKYHFLSNFYPCNILVDGTTYSSAEAAFQAAKCANASERLLFSTLQPAEAKKAGKKVKLREDWEDIKVDVMREIIRTKFTDNPDLAVKLHGTGQAELIEENNWHDNFWGNCVCTRCKSITGKNILGSLLMELRSTYQSKDRTEKTFYGFTCLSRQSYGPDYIKSVTEPRGYVNEVMFGIQDENGGTKSEAAVRWIQLDKQVAPRFEVFTDGFEIFDHVVNIPGFREIMKINPDFSPDDLCRFLVENGFIDMSDNKMA